MTLTAEVLAVGDELVHGKVVDTNSAWLASRLGEIGWRVARICVIGDGEEALCQAMRAACERSDVVVMTGGLGPTEDDRTRRAAAALCGEPLRFDEPSWAHIQQILRVYTEEGRPIPASNRLQAECPQSACVLQNAWGSAPGFSVQVHGCTLYALPGVPREMHAMWTRHLQPVLLKRGQGRCHTHNLHAVGCREADLGERLVEFMREGQSTQVGLTASRGQLTVRVSGFDLADVESTADAIRPLLGEHLVYEGEHGLEQEVARRLIDRGVTVSLAESCTGGQLASALIDVAGISSVFLAGFVTYSPESKVRELGVAPGLLEEHGVVSEAVAGAMAQGVATRSGSRIGVSVTGIAGPGGGSEDNPVGTVCIGVHADGETVTLRRCYGDLGRALLRQRAVREALVQLLRTLARIG